MRRAALAPLVLLLFIPGEALVANPRELTVSTPHGSARADTVSSCVSGPGSTLCADGFVNDPPKLVATPGDTVTLALDGEVDELSASLDREHKISATQVDARTYRLRLPPGEPRRQLLSVFVRYDHPGESGDRSWVVRLITPDTPILSGARLNGLRLSLKITCPAGCDGTLTLGGASTNNLARFPLRGVTTEALTATITPAQRRELMRYSASPLGVHLVTRGQPPIKDTLKLRR